MWRPHPDLARDRCGQLVGEGELLVEIPLDGRASRDGLEIVPAARGRAPTGRRAGPAARCCDRRHATPIPGRPGDAMRRMSGLGKAVLAATCAVIALAPPASVRAQGHLALYCSPQIEWCQAVIAEFTKATWIKVAMTRKSSGETFAQIKAEASNPKGDVWWGGTGGRPRARDHTARGPRR